MHIQPKNNYNIYDNEIGIKIGILALLNLYIVYDLQKKIKMSNLWITSCTFDTDRISLTGLGLRHRKHSC